MWFPERDRWRLQLKGTWKLGKDSGFPACCRTWFLIRGWICNEIVGWELQGKVYDWLENLEFFRNFCHIPCPYHFLMAAVGLYRPRYGTCQKCEWDQLISSPPQPCQLCFRMLSPLHQRCFKVRLKDRKSTRWIRRQYVGRETDLDS